MEQINEKLKKEVSHITDRLCQIENQMSSLFNKLRSMTQNKSASTSRGKGSKTTIGGARGSRRYTNKKEKNREDEFDSQENEAFSETDQDEEVEENEEDEDRGQKKKVTKKRRN